MKTNWLWDIRLTEMRVSKILKDEKDPRFFIYAEKLFSRVSDPKVCFSFMPKHVFCRQWPAIKKRIEKDAWARKRVAFWQSIYRKIEGIPPERIALAEQIYHIRNQLGYTQKQLATKLGVIQQYVSRLESGRENVTIDTLKNIADVLGKRLNIVIS